MASLSHISVLYLTNVLAEVQVPAQHHLSSERDARRRGARVQHNEGHQPALGREVSAQRAAGADQPRGHHLHNQVLLVMKLNYWG